MAETDWGEASIKFDEIKKMVSQKDLSTESEAQTRYDVIDRLIREVMGWSFGQVSVEEYAQGEKRGFVDYILRSGDITIVIEAKKIGSSFPSPTKATKLKISGSILGSGEISKAIEQALDYSRKKIAQITVVTNGLCWCYFNSSDATNSKDAIASTLFPFNDDKDAEELFRLFSSETIASIGLKNFSETYEFVSDNRLINMVADSEMRVGRNNLADFIAPALDNALHPDAILNNPDFLKSCYVYTSARTKFDSTLEMHLADTKPISIRPAERINTGKPHGKIESLVEYGKPTSAPPVTLIIAPVGVGKSTYLKHFELVQGKNLIEANKVHWIYIDFEEMGSGGNVRNFLYTKLKTYLLDNTEYETVVEPAYHDEIEGLRHGHYSLISKNKEDFDKKIFEHINKEFEQVEPYVDKVFKFISTKELCVLVLDNTDLYENENLEKEVLSEGLALAKRLFCHVIISIRDTTYVKHKNDSMFDAFELKKLWLDPPPFKSVLSKRLSLSGLILKGKSARIPLSTKSNMVLNVPDLSVFFDIVQQSILSGTAGEFIEAFSHLNIRKGLGLVRNFLTSGHIHADRAIQTYMADSRYAFPFHEIFKGSIYGQWKYFKESRTDCFNLFDSKINSKNLRLLRICLLSHLHTSAKASEEAAEVNVLDCIEIFSKIGANANQIINVLEDMVKYDLIKSTEAKALTTSSKVFITKTGGYYYVKLCSTMPYVEACMFDTIIDDIPTWHELAALTSQIEIELSISKRMQLRKDRCVTFIEYLESIEKDNLQLLSPYKHPEHLNRIKVSLEKEFNVAIRKIIINERYHS